MMTFDELVDKIAEIRHKHRRIVEIRMNADQMSELFCSKPMYFSSDVMRGLPDTFMGIPIKMNREFEIVAEDLPGELSTIQ